MTYTVIGHFDCGCGQAAQPAPLEVVFCATKDQVESVVTRMKTHAAGHQDWPTPAMAIVVNEGTGDVVFGQEGEWDGCLVFADASSFMEAHGNRSAEHEKRARLRQRRNAGPISPPTND